jgi:hypothetical protein
MDLVVAAIVSALAAGIIFWDAGRVGRTRWWAVLGLVGGGFGLLAWLLWRTFGPQPAGAANTRPHGAAKPPESVTGSGLPGAPVPAGVTPARKCPECKTTDVGEFTFCKKCGADLPT